MTYFYLLKLYDDIGDKMKKVIIGILIFLLVLIFSVKAFTPNEPSDALNIIDIVEYRDYKLDRDVMLSYSVPIDYINEYNKEYKVYRLEDDKMILLDTFYDAEKGTVYYKTDKVATFLIGYDIVNDIE